MSTLKKHLFDDCFGYNWIAAAPERAERHVRDVREVTCGTCKARVLEALRASDWSKLDDETAKFLSRLVTSAVKDLARA